MAIESKKESTLASDSSLSANDKIRMVGSDGKSYTTNIDSVAAYVNSKSTVATDTTLARSGVPADAKKTGTEIARVEALASQETALPAELKTALLNCFQHVAWIDDQGQTYYNALANLLN